MNKEQLFKDLELAEKCMGMAAREANELEDDFRMAQEEFERWGEVVENLKKQLEGME